MHALLANAARVQRVCGAFYGACLSWHKLPYLNFPAFQEGDNERVMERVMERGKKLCAAGMQEDCDSESEDAGCESD